MNHDFIDTESCDFPSLTMRQVNDIEYNYLKNLMELETWLLEIEEELK